MAARPSESSGTMGGPAAGEVKKLEHGRIEVEGNFVLKLCAKLRQLLLAGHELKRDCAGCTPRLRRQSDLPHLYPELGRKGLSDGEIPAASRYFNLG